MEFALPMHPISLKVSLIILIIRQHKLAKSLFRVTNQSSFVEFPFLLNVIKICVVETLIYRCRLVVIHFSMTVKLINKPVTFISQFMVWIVQFSISMHVVVFPFTLVVTGFSIKEFTISISKSIYFLSLVPAPIFIVLYNILSLLVLVLRLRLLIKLWNHCISIRIVDQR